MHRSYNGKELKRHRRNIKPIQVRSVQYGTFRLRVLLTVDDFIFLEDLLERDLAAREFTVRVMYHQLDSPELALETMRAWPDKLLIRVAATWSKHKLTTFKTLPQNIPPFEGFKQIISNYMIEQNRQIGESLRDVAEVIQKNFRDILQPAIESVQAAVAQSLRQIAGFDTLILNALEADGKTIAPLLLEANFWLTPSTHMSLVRRFKELARQDGVTSEIIKQTFIQHYEKDNWSELQRIVSSWQENPYFVARMAVIEDALEAHINGKYTLSVPALLPLIEGVASSILATSAGKPSRIVNDAISNWHTEFLHQASKEILLNLVTSPMLYGSVPPEYFTPEKFAKWLASEGLTESQSLNRHSILHGVQINYASKENSLRAFLLLDVLYFMKRKGQRNN